MPKKLALLAAVFAASGLIAAGCGGDDDAGDTSTAATTETTTAVGATGAAGPALSEEEFVAQGNEICQTAEDELSAEADETFAGQQPSQEEADAFINDVVVPAIQAQIDAIRALNPEDAVAAELDPLLADAEAILEEAEADPSILGPGSEDPFKQVNEALANLGLTECA